MKDHPFFCYKKNCRKSWDKTPEYLTFGDWNLLEGLRSTTNIDEFNQMLHDAHKFDWELVESFFDRVLGWPEGYSYFFFGTPVYQEFMYPKLVTDIEIFELKDNPLYC